MRRETRTQGGSGGNQRPVLISCNVRKPRFGCVRVLRRPRVAVYRRPTCYCRAPPHERVARRPHNKPFRWVATRLADIKGAPGSSSYDDEPAAGADHLAGDVGGVGGEEEAGGGYFLGAPDAT